MKATERQRQEYDSFGPWLLEIKSSDEVPDAFAERFTMDDSVVRALKIPRKVERRNARPGDLLYDYILVLYDDRLHFMNSTDPSEDVAVQYTTVVALRKSVDLLHGELVLFMAQNTISVPFNSVSENLVDEIVDYLELQCGSTETSPLPEPNADIKPLSILQTNLLNKEKKRFEPAVIACQPTIKTDKMEKNFWETITGLLFAWTVREFMILATEKELIIYSSIPEVSHFPKGHYGYSRTYISRARIDEVASSASAVFDAVMDLTFTVTGEKLTFQTGGDGIPAGLLAAAKS